MSFWLSVAVAALVAAPAAILVWRITAPKRARLIANVRH